MDFSMDFAFESLRTLRFSSSDLRGWDLLNDSALLLPGITHVHHIPNPIKLAKKKVTPSVPPKYFLTFQGIRNVGLQGASFVRLNLEFAVNCSRKPPPACRGALEKPPGDVQLPEDVFIAIADKVKNHKETPGEPFRRLVRVYYDIL